MPRGFVRFVIHKLDPDSGRKQGLFHALADLSRAGKLDPSDSLDYQRVRDWFGEHLPKPGRLARSTRPRAKDVALSWFKDTAAEHIRQMRLLADILERHGIQVDMLRTRRPGYVVYEDDHQVAAEPYSDTGA
jgi:hypothetical protein